MWKWIDAIGDWLLNELDARIQLRIGVIMTLASLPFYPYMFFSGEPPVIYFLSVVATTLTGLTLIIGAQALVHLEDAGDPPVGEDQDD